MVYIIKRTPPVVNLMQRNLNLFEAILNGVTSSELGAQLALDPSHVRLIARELAKDLVRHARLSDPSIPFQHTITQEKLIQDKVVWLDRLAKYKASLK